MSTRRVHEHCPDCGKKKRATRELRHMESNVKSTPGMHGFAMPMMWMREEKEHTAIGECPVACGAIHAKEQVKRIEQTRVRSRDARKAAKPCEAQSRSASKLQSLLAPRLALLRQQGHTKAACWAQAGLCLRKRRSSFFSFRRRPRSSESQRWQNSQFTPLAHPPSL